MGSRTFQASECPECGSVKTYIQNVGHDEDGRTIRSRKCSQCDTIFGTVEIVLPSEFSFAKTDTYKRGRYRRKRVAQRSADRIFVGTVKIIPGKKTMFCAKGLHRFSGHNLRLVNGVRHCRSCENATRRIYKMRNREEMNRRARERYHERKKGKHGLQHTGLQSPNAYSGLLAAEDR